ncbi:MAG TPA: type 1 glutamine amidotransferase domain-containing protein [Thermoleophilaceae bacterium]
MSARAPTLSGGLQHREVVDVVRPGRPRVLLVVANTIDTPGFPVSFWASELTHPYLEFTGARYDITIASPSGSRVEWDRFSDPGDDSGWAADDIVTRGFAHTPELMSLLDATPALADLDLAGYDALVVAGGMAPMFTFRGDETIKNAIRAFFEAEKPTAALCHGVSALIDVKLSDGTRLIEGRTITGFANVEEDYGRDAMGMDHDLWPWRIEEAAKAAGANYVQGGLFRSFAVRDGRLITGQQQYSGAAVARIVIAALGV